MRQLASGQFRPTTESQPDYSRSSSNSSSDGWDSSVSIVTIQQAGQLRNWGLISGTYEKLAQSIKVLNLILAVTDLNFGWDTLSKSVGFLSPSRKRQYNSLKQAMITSFFYLLGCDAV